MNTLLNLAKAIDGNYASGIAKCIQLVNGTERFDSDILFQNYLQHWMYKYDSALHVVAAGHNAEGVQSLLKLGLSVNDKKNRRMATPLHYAADAVVDAQTYSEERQRDTLVQLLKGEADIDAADKNGATPIMRAVRCRAIVAVDILMRYGADLTIKNNKGSNLMKLAMVGSGRGGSGSVIAKANQAKIILLLKGRI